jgi:hypothetical protein
MKFRPYVSPGAQAPGGRRTATHEITLQHRSAYLMAGAARNAYEHHIPPAAALRYSITFRTLRPGRRAGTHLMNGTSTEGGEASGQQGATTENTGSI